MKLYEETFDAIARIDIPEERANQHLQTVRSLFEYGHEESATALVPETLNLIDRLEDPKQKLFLLRLTGALLAERGKFPLAFAVLEQMDSALLAGKLLHSESWKEEVENNKDFLFSSISRAQAQRGLLDDAIAAAGRIENFVEYESALHEILQSLDSSNPDDIPKCERLLGEMESPNCIISSLFAIAKIQHRLGLAEEALETAALAERKAESDSLEDPMGKYEAFSEIIEHYLEIYFSEPSVQSPLPFEHLVALASKIDAFFDSCSTWTDLARNRLKFGDREAAEQLLERAVKNFHESGEKPHDFANPSRIAQVYALLDQPEPMKRYFRKAIAGCDRETSSFLRIMFRARVAQSLAESGERSAAEKLYRQTVSIANSEEIDFLRCKYLHDLAEMMLRDHFTEEALEVVESLGEPLETEFTAFETHELSLARKSMALSMAAKILFQEENNPPGQETALRLREESTSLARQLTDPVQRAEALRQNAEIEALPV